MAISSLTGLDLARSLIWTHERPQEGKVALVYAANLTVVERASGDPAKLEDVARLIGDWAGVDRPLDEDDRPGARPSSTVTTRWLARENAFEAWGLTLTHLDSGDPNIQWSVDTVVITSDSTEAQMRLDRTRLDGSVGPSGDRPRPPRCIQALINSPTLAALDAHEELSVEPTVVRREDAPEFARLICNPERRLPVIAYTPRDEDVIDGQPLSHDLAGLTHVRLVLSEASWALGDLVPRGVNVYGGAARIIWPGVTQTIAGPQHPLWFADAPAQRIYAQITSRVVTAGVARAQEDPRILELERHKRQEATRALSASLVQMRERLELGQLEAEEATDRIREAEETVSKLAEDRDFWESLASEADGERSQLKQDLLNIRSERDYWKSAAQDAFEALRAGGMAFDEAERQLRAEIDAVVVGLSQVEGARVRQYDFGTRFIDAVTALGPSYREKVVRTCATIVASPPRLLGAREDHELRCGVGANEEAVKRGYDGARGRRIAIEQGTPAARRLHYWVLSHGSVQLASVNVHEDMTIPEN